MSQNNRSHAHARWRQTVYRIIYKADTPLGKWFDLLLIICILCSVASVMLHSVTTISTQFRIYLNGLEWLFTILFSIEYILRIICIPRPLKYIFSFYGIVDFVAIIPSYLSFFLSGTSYFLVIRVLRLLRIFRILKLAQYVGQINILLRAVFASRRKITVFLFFICTMVVIFGSAMYLIEGPEHGFTSIPRGIYWAIVTLTTVGYGDISPKTNLGQALASLVMITGYSVIAVPTGIFTAELAQAISKDESRRICPSCNTKGHETIAVYCNICGARLED